MIVHMSARHLLCEETFNCLCCISFYLVLFGYLLVATVAGKMGD